MSKSSAITCEDLDRASWVQVAEECAFSIRDTAEPVVFRDRMWLSNGYCENASLKRDLWQSGDGAEWTCVCEETPYDPYSEMTVYQDKVWAVKGSVWNSEDGEHWRQVAAETPFGTRGYGELVVWRGRMWQLGSGRDVWHTDDGVHWECATEDAGFGHRHGTAVFAYDDKLWLMAGATNETSDPPEKTYPKYTTHNDVWCSADGANWECVLEHAPWAPRMWVVAEAYAGRLWIFGGFSNRKHINFAEAWHTTDGVTWRECVSAPMFCPRHEVSPYVYRGSLWVVAGNSWPLLNDSWRLELP